MYQLDSIEVACVPITVVLCCCLGPGQALSDRGGVASCENNRTIPSPSPPDLQASADASEAQILRWAAIDSQREWVRANSFQKDSGWLILYDFVLRAHRLSRQMTFWALESTFWLLQLFTPLIEPPPLWLTYIYICFSMHYWLFLTFQTLCPFRNKIKIPIRISCIRIPICLNIEFG